MVSTLTEMCETWPHIDSHEMQPLPSLAHDDYIECSTTRSPPGNSHRNACMFWPRNRVDVAFRRSGSERSLGPGAGSNAGSALGNVTDRPRRGESPAMRSASRPES